MVPGVLQQRSRESAAFFCHHCGNHCKITRWSKEDRVVLQGAVCGRWEDERVLPEAPIPGEDPWAHRERLVLHHTRVSAEPMAPAKALGIPRATTAPELLPLWAALARAMGHQPVLSGPATWRTLTRGRQRLPEAACPPLQVAAGQVLELVEQGVDHLLLPRVDEEAAHHLESLAGATIYAPEVHLDGGPATAMVPREAAEDLGLSSGQLAAAIQEGIVSAHRLRRDLQAIGRGVLGDGSAHVAVVIGRTAALEPLLGAGLVAALDRHGLPSLPMECLHLDSVRLDMDPDEYCSTQCMDQARAAALCAGDDRMIPVLVQSAGCTSDDELSAHLRQLLAHRPRLVLDVAEARSAIALANRVEAFAAALSLS